MPDEIPKNGRAVMVGGFFALAGGALVKLTSPDPFSVTSLALLGLVVPTAIIGLIRVATTTSSLTRRGWALLIVVGALPAMSIAWSIDPSASLRRALLLLVTVGIALWLSEAGKERLRSFASGYLLVALALPVLMSVTQGSFSLFEDAGGRGTMTLGFRNTNEMARNVLLAVAAIAMFRPTPTTPSKKRRPSQSTALGLTFLWLAALVLYHFSRSAQVLAVSAVGTLALLYRPYLHGTFWGATRPALRSRRQARSIVAIATLPLLAYFGQRVMTSAADRTLSGRTHIWEIARNAVETRPFQGWGYGVFWEQLSPDFAPRPLSLLQSVPAHAHNGYMEVYVSFGLLLGTLAILVLAASALQSLKLASAGEWLVLWVSFAYAVTASTLLRPWSLAWVLPLAILFFWERHSRDYIARRWRIT